MMDNAFTIDVEDYYMVTAFAGVVGFERWRTYESRVEKNTYALLGLLEEHRTRATFFILGWVAERFPQLVRAISTAGHEVACHGYNHRLIYDLDPAEFREDLRKAKSLLENITGNRVLGYRATSYSIVKDTLWALDALIEEGFCYDSSIFPVYHDHYGFPGSKRFCSIVERPSGSIIEFPPSTYRLLGQNIPIGGGGYLRLFPLAVTKAGIRSINEHEQEPCIVYVHPWEIDPEQPRIKAGALSTIRHYINLSSTLPKLESILSEFTFRPLNTFLDRAVTRVSYEKNGSSAAIHHA